MDFPYLFKNDLSSLIAIRSIRRACINTKKDTVLVRSYIGATWQGEFFTTALSEAVVSVRKMHGVTLDFEGYDSGPYLNWLTGS